ncbi:MAG: leucine-rich repeat protein [Paludibacteraceae bacterium]|nr:leucine-rich repeat protein [Paludibacteraceae bacterium]
MIDKIKQLQLVHNQGEIKTQFSPNNVFYIQDDDKVIYYQVPYIKISATTSGTVRVQETKYEPVATIFHEEWDEYMGEYTDVEDTYTYTPNLNKPDWFAYTGTNTVSTQNEVVYLRHIKKGIYNNEKIQVYEAIENQGTYSVGELISAYTISDYLIEAYKKVNVDAVYPPTKNYKIPTKDTFSFTLSENRKYITDLYISKGIGNVPRNSCSTCIALSGITIEDGITAIYGNAFNGCTSLTDITIPESVTSITSTSFKGCTNLTTIRYKGTATGFPWGATNATLLQ